MNKNFKYFGIFWLFTVALFNAVTFSVPRTIGGMDRFATSAFWVAYGVCTAAFVAQLALAFPLFRERNKDKLFLRLPLLQAGYTALVLSLLTGLPFLIIPQAPAWLGAVLCSAVVCLYAFIALRAVAAGENAEAVGERTAAKTAFIRSLTASAEALTGYVSDEQTALAVRRVQEALRSADPVSEAVLNDIEEEIFEAYNRFEEAVRGGDNAAVALLCEKVILLVRERAAKCKLLKR